MMNDRIKELIARARIVSFANWQDLHSSEAIAIFQAAEDARVYLTDADYQQLAALSPQTSSLIPVSKLLRDNIVDIVDETRAKLLDRFPTIDKPGGALYPAERAEACWRDFWHYMRPIAYGLAGGSDDYLSEEGMKNMQLLYQELHVPLDAMLLGLEEMKKVSLSKINSDRHEVVSPYFDRLISQLKTFLE